METMEGTGCAFSDTSLLVYPQSPSSLTLDPMGSAPKTSAGFLEYLSWLSSLSEDTAFVSFPSSVAHSHDTPPALAQAQSSWLT